ncbi:DsrE family protein [uncultured Desulfovibrio sp.]|uniref:DsrE family protein n=1 Tax=uncultured Desulfovibrio sp. TaxID=167968 RepID=UPI0026369604|nr:DsrE family protein [uncultured Desulfovibrio sp.]
MNYDLCLHIDSNEPAMLRMVLKNASNYIKGLPGESFQLAVVANGPAVTLFTDEHADLRELAAPLLDQGVRVMLCANALADNSIEHSRLWQGCTVVPAGLVEVVRLQREGFAYIKP